MTDTTKTSVEQQREAVKAESNAAVGEEARGRLLDTLSGEEVNWSDGMGSRSRRSWLLLVKGEEIIPFSGEGIPGVVALKGTDYNKNGKWSHNTYRLVTAPGVRAIPGMDGWETGRFVEGLRSAAHAVNPIDTWADVAQALGVSVPSAMTFLRQWRPKAADALDEVDAQLDALDDAADQAEALDEAEKVVVSFGAPTRRAREEGFWESPKGIPGHNGEIRLIDTTKGWVKDNVRVFGMVGTVLFVTHASGHGGGYVSVTVAVVPGSKVDEPEKSKAAPATAVAENMSPASSAPSSESKPQPPASGWTAEDLKAKFSKR